MAAMLGVSRNTVNDSLVSLQSAGAVRFERHRMIININTLERIVMKTGVARAYVLLRTREGDLAETTAIVRRQPGVVMADQIEGAADVIFAVQACDRESLAALMVRAIAAVEDRTEDIQLMPAREESFVSQ
jgi:DNA-binding GntR family transcriptional regulator